MFWGFTIAGTLILVRLCMWLSTWLPLVFGEAATALTALLILAAYVACVWYAVRWFDQVDPTAEIDPATMTELPPTMPTVLSGVFYILPVFILIWCLMVLDQSPGLAAFYACSFLGFMLITQRPLIAWFLAKPLGGTVRHGFLDLYKSLELGGRNMLGIAIATAVAGLKPRPHPAPAAPVLRHSGLEPLAI